MKKLAFISPIFHPQAFGGSERLALEIAVLLSGEYEIHIYTSCARNYLSWKNEFSPGTEVFGSMHIHRFPVTYERDIRKFNSYYSRILRQFPNVSEKEYSKWLELQGPNTPSLISRLSSDADNFDSAVFFSYLYFPVLKTIPLFKGRAVFCPAVHDEPPVYFPIYKEAYTDDLVYSFHTPEEKILFSRIFGYTPSKSFISGMNVVLSESDEHPDSILDFPYVLYVGRVEKGKNVHKLIEFFLEWKKQSSHPHKLVIVGGGDLLEKNEMVVQTGYVNEQQKYLFLKHCSVFINPSPHESFSISLMEAWLSEKPALVNGESDVLRAHCVRSNGGLYYSDSESFVSMLNFFMNNPEKSERMGHNGSEYVRKNYSSERIRQIWTRALNEFVFDSELNI